MAGWIIVAEESVLPGLAAAARRLDQDVRAVVVGGRGLADRVAAEADHVDWFETTAERPVEAWTSAVAEHLRAAGARVVLTGNAPASRVLIGYAAARLAAPLFDPVQGAHLTADGIEVTRLLYGGIALERDLAGGPVCLVVEGSPAAAVAERAAGSVNRVACAQPVGLTCVAEDRSSATGRDLGTAARVIGVGRGIREPQYLDVVAELAEAMGAEIACSRPVAEDLGWLPQDRYLGVSGRRVAPRLYLMLGISGEVQHMIGVRDAELIVAVNNDERAPVMTGADIAVCADLRTLVPALIAELQPAERSA